MTFFMNDIDLISKSAKVARNIKDCLVLNFSMKTGNADVDVFLGFIKRDIHYIKQYLNEPIRSHYVSSLTDLAVHFVQDDLLKNSKRTVRQFFLNALIELEMHIYRMGESIVNEQVNITSDDLLHRMILFGVEKEYVVCNSGIAYAAKLIDFIGDHSYPGCGFEIVRVIEASQCYVSQVFDEINLVGAKELLKQTENSFYMALSGIKKTVAKKVVQPDTMDELEKLSFIELDSSIIYRLG